MSKFKCNLWTFWTWFCGLTSVIVSQKIELHQTTQNNVFRICLYKNLANMWKGLGLTIGCIGHVRQVHVTEHDLHTVFMCQSYYFEFNSMREAEFSNYMDYIQELNNIKDPRVWSTMLVVMNIAKLFGTPWECNTMHFSNTFGGFWKILINSSKIFHLIYILWVLAEKPGLKLRCLQHSCNS